MDTGLAACWRKGKSFSSELQQNDNGDGDNDNDNELFVQFIKCSGEAWKIQRERTLSCSLRKINRGQGHGLGKRHLGAGDNKPTGITRVFISECLHSGH